ncbi:hypothetical protein E2A64_14960 [Pseudohoeflea suaedae]|uniref:DUF680 domain-containing protein n=1 Tax=Pseudohoeflea suaedae TaxID=877384 RepID=A0A4R5PIF8_9HYPH|nr:hypothetical protein [Pseudohoeflea suaedae]TDH35016.1 hypothetical protein E2A64_14960 [Pseudohoeflea suaedae]
MKNIIAAMIATLTIATAAAPAVAAETKAPATAACEQVAKGQTADVDCTVTNTIARDPADQGSAYPSAPTSIGGGVWL